MLKELESKHRAEAARWKKKMDSTIAEMEKELLNERDEKEAAMKAGQEAEDSYNHLASEFDEVTHVLEETKSSLQVILSG